MKVKILMALIFSFNTSASTTSLQGLVLQGEAYDQKYIDSIYQIRSQLFDAQSFRDNLFPKISAKITNTYTEADVSGKEQQVTSDGDYRYLSKAISLDQPLFDMSLFTSLSASKHRVISLELSARQAWGDLVRSVIGKYRAVIDSHADLEYQQAKENVIKHTHDLVIAEYQQGLQSKLALQSSKLDYYRVKEETSQKRIYLQDARSALFDSTKVNSIAGYPECKDLISATQIELSNELNIFSHVGMDELRAEIDTLVAERKSIKAQYLPKLSASATYEQSERFGGSFDGSKNEQVVYALNFSIPIYQGGERSSSLKKLSFQIENKRSQYALMFSRLSGKLDYLKNKIDLLTERYSNSVELVLNAEGIVKIRREEEEKGMLERKTLLEEISSLKQTEYAYQSSCTALLMAFMDIRILTGQPVFIGALNK